MKYRIALVAAGIGTLALALVVGRGRTTAADKKEAATFPRTTIDLGMVVSDVEKSAKFYTEAIGFTETKGFSVGAEFCTDAGLTDGKALTIRVFVLGEGESATRLKLMQIPGAKPKKDHNHFVSSELGYRYLTIFVSDTTAAEARLKKAGVAPIAKGPVALPKELSKTEFLTVVRDPDGNLVELVGPKK